VQVLGLPEIVYKKAPGGKEEGDNDDCIGCTDTVGKGNDDENDGGNDENTNDVQNGTNKSEKETDVIHNDDSVINNTIKSRTEHSLNLSETEVPTISLSNRERNATVISSCTTTTEHSASTSPTVSIDTPTTPILCTPKEGVPDEEQPAEVSSSLNTQRMLRSFITTTCTTCSICIEEFEEGEKIRLLPLCGHAFHTECILPWLKDRQGCCPLCKMGVLGSAVGNSNSNDSNAAGGEDETR